MNDVPKTIWLLHDEIFNVKDFNQKRNFIITFIEGFILNTLKCIIFIEIIEIYKLNGHYDI